MSTTNILFVCTGNTCRSPMAEYLLIERAAGLLDIDVASAGIAAWPGSPASTYSIQAMRELEIDISNHRSQSLTAEIVDAANLIVVMTSAHRETIYTQFPGDEKKTVMLHSFGTESGEPDVADPFGLSIAAYRKTRDEIDSAISDLILDVKNKQAS